MPGGFVEADITKIAKFIQDSKDASTEFEAIRKEFERINRELLKDWKGLGADAYKYETDHILEKVGSVEEVLKAIAEGAIADIRDSYSELDEELGEYNQNPSSGESEEE